jgi:hypothetical protein
MRDNEASYLDEMYDIEYDIHDAIQNHRVWVERDKTVTPIGLLDTKHMQRIVRCLGRGKNCYGQSFKLPVILAELTNRSKNHLLTPQEDGQ